MASTTEATLRRTFLGSGSDSCMAVGVVAILMVMIIPLPPFLLDFLLALNITFSIVVLLMAMYTVKPLDNCLV